MDKTDIHVMEVMLADRILVPIRKRVEAAAKEIVHQFVTSMPKPKPSEVAKVVFQTEIKLEVIYGIMEKLQEYKHGPYKKHLKQITKNQKSITPKDLL